MGIYKYIREAWNENKAGDLWRQRLIDWRKEDSTVREEQPIRLDRARSIGYRAKPGFIVVRQRVIRGGHQRPAIKGGRRPKHFHRHLSLRKGYQMISEERAQTAYPNLVVLNSYFLAKDGKRYWYEVILVDPEHPVIKADEKINWICSQRSRAFRGLTSSGKKSRGI